MRLAARLSAFFWPAKETVRIFASGTRPSVITTAVGHVGTAGIQDGIGSRSLNRRTRRRFGVIGAIKLNKSLGYDQTRTRTHLSKSEHETSTNYRGGRITLQ